eukprot:COSAG05_NODE_60_length_23142_cov_25.372130_8_plen_46_part_00
MAVWKLLEAYGAVLRPRLFVVKAFKLVELLKRCVLVHCASTTTHT